MSKAIPEIVEPIKKASRMGYNTQQILGYLSKSVTPRNTKGMSESQIHAQNRIEDNQRAKHGLSIAAAAVAAPIATTAARSALSRALPLPLKNAIESTVNTNAQQNLGADSQNSMSIPQQQEQPQQQNPLTNPSQPPSNTNIVQQQQALPQAEVKTIDPTQILSNTNTLGKVNDLIATGNNPEAIGAFFRKFQAPVVKQVEKEAGKPFEEVISEYIQKQPPPEASAEGAKPEPKSPISPETTQKPIKGAIVETPDGIGEVREIRNGKALVEVDGKMRKMLEEELMEPGLPQKDLADLHEELIEGIKQQTGKEVSRHVEWAGYDPEHKELVYRPWGDKEYVYDNIDPEDVEMLTNLLTQRKTTGENYIGSWEAGTESPIGAAMHALITKVRNKAKESGQEKAHKRRYEAVYSAYEPAQKASKQKKEAEKKRLKDEEKRRKKAEKQALQHSRSPSRVS